MGDETQAAGTATDDDKVFRIGLAMAGAVSAGAYTAGVVDFLLEALDAIADTRAGRSTDHLEKDAEGKPLAFEGMKPVVAPPYEAQIAAMSGTSAGAMVTAILGAMLQTRVDPVTGATTPGKATENPLYDCWVDQIHIDKLLSTGDLEGDGPVRSLLNSDPLKTIADDAIRYAQNTDYLRPYVADPLPVHLCVGNMRGVPYALRLRSDGDGAENGHQMTLHADNVAFELHSSRNAAPVLRPDRVVLRAGDPKSPWSSFAATCLASGAFPIGLAPRLLARDYVEYEMRDWYVPTDGHVRRKRKDGVDVDPADSPDSWEAPSGSYETLKPLYKADDYPGRRYDFVCVDGGVFNNEPLELCRRALAKDGRNPREPDKAHAAVLLIDPFPDPAARPGDFKVEEMNSLLGVAQHLLGVMIAQSRFKPDELALARNADVASRFAILPSRRDAQDKPATPAVASGILGAFGGFFSREFRHHDFMLGRRNCQRFLARTFVLQADRAKGKINPIVGRWLDDPAHERFLLTGDDSPYEDEDGSKIAALPIIPLLGKLASGDYTAMPPWPSRPADVDADVLRAQVDARSNLVVTRLLDEVPNFAFRVACKGLWQGYARRKAKKTIMGWITTGMAKLLPDPGGSAPPR